MRLCVCRLLGSGAHAHAVTHARSSAHLPPLAADELRSARVGAARPRLAPHGRLAQHQHSRSCGPTFNSDELYSHKTGMRACADDSHDENSIAYTRHWVRVAGRSQVALGVDVEGALGGDLVEQNARVRACRRTSRQVT